MAKTFVPINVDEKLDFEKTIENLKRMKADRVYIAIVSRYPLYKCEERTNTIKLLAEKSKRVQAEGFETAAWVSTLGYGGKVLDINEEVSNKLTHKRSMTGEVARDAFCSLDPEFVRIECEFIKEIAEAGIKMIMLDDELVQAILPGLACTCDLHLAEYRRRLGEDIKPEEIRDKVYTGGKSRYRDIWLDMLGDTLRTFCKALRTAVDEVDPDIRMGFCAGCTSFDLEGVDAIELSHILAGRNKPFLRFTGARRLPVECNGHPMLYCVCKEDSEGLSVAYFNCHADEIRNADVKLNIEAKTVEFINCKGSFRGDSIEIESIKPYEFAGVRIIKG